MCVCMFFSYGFIEWIFGLFFYITGSLCTIDICLRRLEDVGTIDVKGN